jgi:hypothetical protein
MRSQKESDFFIELEGVGQFRFGRRTFGDRAKIKAEYIRYIGNVKAHDEQEIVLRFFNSIKDDKDNKPDGWDKVSSEVLNRIYDISGIDQEVSAYAAIISSYKILCVECPKGWENIEDMELDAEKDKQVFALFDAVQAKEDFFRKGANTGSKA